MLQKMLLSNGAKPNAADDDGRTSLIWAADAGHLKIAEVGFRSQDCLLSSKRFIFQALLTLSTTLPS